MTPQPSMTTCFVCGEVQATGDPGLCGGCLALRDAASTGALPQGVPVRVYGGYLEARAALRANAAAAAVRTLQWLLGHIAEERGAKASMSFREKVDKLRHDEVISARYDSALFARAISGGTELEDAWALLSIVEHVFYRLYLKS